MTNSFEESQIDDLVRQYEKYEEDVRTMFTEFLAYDKDHTCTLDKKELGIFFEEHGLFEHMKSKDAKAFLEQHIYEDDNNHDGVIDFQEFVHLHNKLVKFRNEQGLPALKKFSRNKLHEKATSTAKEKEHAHHQVDARKKKEAQKVKHDFQQVVSQDKTTQALMQAFHAADTTRCGRVALEDFMKEMIQLGFISEHTNSHRFEDFVKHHPVMAELTFDMVLQIMFPKLSTSQRKDLAARVKVPLRDPEKGSLEYLSDHEREARSKKSILKENKVELDDAQRRDMCRLFKNWDTDSDGTISLEEFVKMMSDVHTEEECAALFKEIDLDESSTLEVWEFVAWWTSSSAQGLDHASAFSQHLLGFIAEGEKNAAELI
mmetsp:Transcript_33878/g.46918  ORF Transcript_33878/g.46918 Transcript_33878/m.46918 type:complete len:374 (+) Transcript_33878:72-1193(+)